MSDRPTTEPRTEAGKALAARAKREAWSNWEGLAQFTIPAIEAEAVQGAAPLTDNQREAIAQQALLGAAPRAEGWGVQDDGLDVERLVEAESNIRKRLRERDPESCLWMDGKREHIEALLAEYAYLRAASPLNASGDER